MKNTAVVLVILGIFVLCGCTTLYHVKSNDFKIESVNNQALVFGSYHTDYLINPDINMYDYFISIRLKPVGNDSSKEYFLDMDQKQGYIMAVLKPGKYQVNQLVFNAKTGR